LAILAGLSLLLFLATAVLWVRSYLAPSAANPSTARVQRALAARVPAVNFNNVTRRDAVDFLREVSGVEFSVDWAALEASGINPDEPVSRTFSNVRVGEALAWLLCVETGSRFITKGDVIHISTKAVLAYPGAARELDRGNPAQEAVDPIRQFQRRRAAITPATKPNSPVWEAVLGDRRWTLVARRGVLRLWFSPADPAAVYQEGVAVGNAAGPEADTLFAFLGFSVRSGSSPFRSVVVEAPFWGVAAVMTILSLLWLRLVARQVRRRRRKKLGLCLECGYDLRASKERCPECGTAVPAGHVTALGCTDDAGPM
jgi:hypothetical protein